MAYPAMLTFVPSGLLGLVVAGLLMAYVSTISTHFNWGTSYLVHDFYRRFVRSGQPERHYVQIGRWTTAGLMVVAALFTLLLETARGSFDLLLSVGAGTGLLYLLRWLGAIILSLAIAGALMPVRLLPRMWASSRAEPGV
jgi:solute:Na+ symporter, SSS family